MPLITSTTQLNKWKFGKGPWSDKRGGGNSNQPYIDRDIPGVQYNNPNQTFESVAEGDLPVRSGPDFLLRNGFLAPADAARDVSRLSQMFFDLKSPNGLLFIAKENLLSRTSVSTQASGGPGYGMGAVNQGIYTPLSTLGQAATGFGGNHLNLLGLDPTDPISAVVEGSGFPGLGLQTYESAVKNYQGNYGNFIVGNNRLTALYDGVTNNTSTNNFGFVKNYNLLPNSSKGSPLLISYGGGPGSVLGIGKTNIRFADQRTGKENNLATADPTYFYTGSRPNSKTTDSWISPIVGGASTQYENIIGEAGSLTEGQYNSNGGYTTTPTFDYLTTETTSSLTPRGDIGIYQTSRWNSRTTSSWISPITGGTFSSSSITSKFLDSKGLDLNLLTQESFGKEILNPDGGYSYTQNWEYNVSLADPSNPRLDTYQTSRWSGKTTGSFISPVSNSLSRKYEEYTDTLLPEDITSGSFTFDQNWDYNTTDSGSLTPRGDLNLFQTTLKSVQTRDGELQGGIRINYSSSISPSGSSNLYKSLTRTKLDNNYTDKYFFNVYDPSTTLGNTWPTNTPLIYANNTKTFSQQQLINKENVIEGGQSGLYPTDFRKELYNVDGGNLKETKNSSVISLSPDYRAKNKDVRLYMGQPGKQGGQLRGDSQANGLSKNVWNYGIKATELTALDKITAMPMYEGVGPDTNQAIDDLVKFRIAAINNDKTDGSAVYMHFRAFLDSFSDSYSATWNPVNYVGRGDTLYNYGGFGRTISLSFTTAAQSKAELIPMYKKLNYLASTLAPDYTGAGFMRGNMVRLTVGGYLYEQPGFITSLTYDVPQESSWEIAINEAGNSDNSVKELPHMIKVSSFAFTPIHNFLAQKPTDPNTPTSRFISLSNGVNSNYTDEYLPYTGKGNGGGDNNIAT